MHSRGRSDPGQVRLGYLKGPRDGIDEDREGADDSEPAGMT